MARKLRVHYPGALYHVMVRGNNGENVFAEEVQKNRYLEIVAFYKEKIGFLLYAYCIMSNHAHLLIEVATVPLSRIMQRIQQVYTQWANRKYDRTGHIFQQRYKALLCDKENYLLQLIKYINNNPVEANLEQGIDYRWSSHASYLGERDSLVDSSLVLSMFSDNRARARERYLEFMDQGDARIVYRDAEEEVQSVKADLDGGRDGWNKYLEIDNLMEKVCNNENVKVEDVVKKTRLREISDIRKAIVLLSERHCDVSNKTLAQRLNLSPSMISKIKSDSSEGSARVAEIVGRWGG